MKYEDKNEDRAHTTSVKMTPTMLAVISAAILGSKKKEY